MRFAVALFVFLVAPVFALAAEWKLHSDDKHSWYVADGKVYAVERATGVRFVFDDKAGRWVQLPPPRPVYQPPVFVGNCRT